MELETQKQIIEEGLNRLSNFQWNPARKQETLIRLREERKALKDLTMTMFLVKKQVPEVLELIPKAQELKQLYLTTYHRVAIS